MGTRLTVDRFISDDSPISHADQLQIFSNSLKLSNDPAFGLTLGHMLTPSAHGALGFLSNCSPTLLSALRDFSKYLPTRVDFGRLDLRISEEYVVCNMQIRAQEELIYRLIAEAFSLSLHNLLQNILGAPISGAKLYFSFPRPHYWRRYEEHLSCEIHFGAEGDQLRLPITLAHVSNAASDFQTYLLCKEHCQRQLSTLDTRSGTSERVRKILLMASPEQNLTMEDVAETMLISKRTLARRLQNEGISFRQIREEVVIALAKSYLAETDLPIDEIASLLTYHDSSSFRRAFKRAAGQSPLAFRMQSNE